MASSSDQIQYHIHVVGKWMAPDFHKLRTAAEFLASTRSNVKATVEGYFETQYEMRLKKIAHTLGGAFFLAKPSSTLVYAIADDEKALYFNNMDRFMEWAEKRFKYEDSTSILLYKRMANKSQQQHYAKNRKYCQLTFQFDGKEEEPVAFELFYKECPRVVENFLALVQSGRYLGSPIHRVKEDCFIQGGDIVDGSGSNSVSSTGSPIPDDSFKYKHDSAGLVGMCKSRLDTNGSQFYITLDELPYFDGKNLIFGRVISGMRTMWKISRLQTNYAGRPVKTVKISAVRSDLLDKKSAEISGDNVKAGEENDAEREEREAAEDQAAAVKVQSMFRGKAARKDVESKVAAKKQKELEEKMAAEQAERERAEEEEAATKVQALYKGKKARRRVDDMKQDKGKAGAVTYESADVNAASGGEEVA
ncbi:unnamed protein product [Amoebophrya sp. A25]|nr:unnamed protein product [Amoebophrya sp. A25]|eukprot:GSA25T00011270001.1